MDERNPYAPSRASLRSGDAPPAGDQSGVTAWRNQNVLVMIPDTPLPPRCIKCNEPADEPTKVRKVYWHHPGVYALILINLIVYAIVAAIVRKKALVAPGLCAEHKKRRRLGLAIGWGGVLAGIGLMTWGVEDADHVAYVPIGSLVLLISIILSMFLSRVVVARKIDQSYVWLRGCGAQFLDSLPPLP
jgi:hypothetical protein